MTSAKVPLQPTPIILPRHFSLRGQGLDAYKPKSKFDTKTRQDEVQEVVERLAAFKPTKIAVERRFAQQEALNREYTAFLQGELELPGDEVYQLGFQLAKQLEHDGLYGVSAWERYYDPPLDLERIAQGRSATELSAFIGEHYPDFHRYEDLENYARQHEQSHFLEEWDAFSSAYEREDAKRLEQSLRDTLRQANEPENSSRGHGVYMVGPFKIGVGKAYPGVDWVTNWYNRNLRIFANLQRITEPPEDRILLIIGGHIPILRHCVEASPEYELVEVSAYL